VDQPPAAACLLAAPGKRCVEDEIALSLTGINPPRSSSTPLPIGATLPASLVLLSRAPKALSAGILHLSSRRFILAIVVLGGMGSQLGVESWRAIIHGPFCGSCRGVNLTSTACAFGLMMVADALIWRPQGLLP